MISSGALAVGTVLVPPSIVTQPVAQAVALGAPATFSVEAEGLRLECRCLDSNDLANLGDVSSDLGLAARLQLAGYDRRFDPLGDNVDEAGNLDLFGDGILHGMAFQAALASCPAFLPARRPKTEPLSKPVPPG